MTFLKTLFATALVLVPFSAVAAPYEVDYSASEVGFSGTHAGNAFAGTFKKWQAEIDFDAAKPETSSIRAVFDLNEAKTGNAMYDGSLPQADWFDVKNHPEAVFVSEKISKTDAGKYLAEGKLTLRGLTHPAAFEFDLTESGDQAVAHGKLVIDRLLYEIGKKSDDAAEWVSREIAVVISLKATKKAP